MPIEFLYYIGNKHHIAHLTKLAPEVLQNVIGVDEIDISTFAIP